MTVRIQSGTTVFINSGQTVQTPQAQNAGTITNAGTTQQFRSNVASGSGSGLGTTRLFTTTTRASGIGDAVGTAIDTRVKTVSAGADPRPDIQVNRLSTREIGNDETVRAIEIRNAGTVTNAGTTQVSQLPVGLTIGLVINSSSTREIERDEISQAVEIRNAGTITNAGTTRVSQAPPREGIGEGVGTARTSPISFPRAAGLGEGIGDALTARQTPKRASGIGDAVGTAIDTRVKTVSAGADPRPDIQVNGFSTREIERDEIIQAVEIQNAGTVTNAGTTRVSQTPPRQGIGEGVGTARTSPIPFSKAAGLGEGFGTTTAQPDTKSVASGIGEGIGTADQAPLFTRIAAGLGEGFGTTTAQPDTDSVASGVGEMFGQATTSRLTDRQASGVGEMFGTGNQFVFDTIAASGFGEMLGTARKPIPFDPIQQIVNLINKTNDSRWRYGKPERIAPIWEYSHNDRINFPNAAFYIYTPAESTVDKFGIEGDSFNQTITIEILIMTLEATETQGYVGDTAEFITQLYNDNTRNTVQFHRFGNITASDLRNEHMGQQTDHYLASVTFEIQRFDAIRDLESVGAFR
ncbi:hypothetical protein 7778G3F11_34 [Haloquadratum phage sp.]|nr:hypothetical protein 7778G3F11_34 [Haloquadratum phage sp.]